MYRCDDCGRYFEEPMITYDDPSPIGVALPQGAYAEYRCPYCASEWIEEAGECASCGEPIPSGQTLCDDCLQDLKSSLGDLANEMHMSVEQLEDAVVEIYEEV
jgi:DNA-directed RNA polymerase subunit RPC12/RpoP